MIRGSERIGQIDLIIRAEKYTTPRKPHVNWCSAVGQTKERKYLWVNTYIYINLLIYYGKFIMNTCKRKAGGASSESGDSNDLPQTSGRQQSYESEPATEPLGFMM